MKALHVALLPGELPAKGMQQNQAVIVIDVLRASTSIIAALAAGAKAVMPVASLALARAQAAKLGDEAVLGGERRGYRPRSFVLGNSPLEYVGSVVSNKVVVLTTTNGTYTLNRCRGAGALAIAAYYNAAAAAQWATAQLEQGRELVIACAGTRRRFTLEDACAAGMIVQLIMANVTGVTLSDAANAAVALWQSFDGNALRTLQASQQGQYLASAGFARDIAFCAQTSKEGLVPQLEEQILLPVLFNSCICRDG